MTSRLRVLAAVLVVGPWACSRRRARSRRRRRPAAGDRARTTTTRVSDTRKNLGAAVAQAAERGDLAHGASRWSRKAPT